MIFFLTNPANAYAGLSGEMTIVQSASGSDIVQTWGTTWKFASGTKPTLSTASNAVDILPFYCRSSTFCAVGVLGGVQ